MDPRTGEVNVKSIDPAVLKETRFVAAFVLIFSMVLQAVFLIIGKWDLTVLWGNLLSATVAILNFFLLGLSVTKALDKDPKDVASYMKLSKTYRYLMILAILGVGIYFKCFNDVAVIVPMLFPQIAIFIRGLTLKKKKVDTEGGKTDAV